MFYFSENPKRKKEAKKETTIINKYTESREKERNI